MRCLYKPLSVFVIYLNIKSERFKLTSLSMGSKKSYLAVISIQAIYAGMILLSKAVFNGGMNSYIFMFYRQLVGTVFLFPLVMIFER